MEKKDETIPGQMSILDLIEEEPQSFEDYIGQCRFCMFEHTKSNRNSIK